MYRKYQTDSAESQLQLKIEEELHDAQRVQTYGQEEDLKLALKMVMKRVTQLVQNDNFLPLYASFTLIIIKCWCFQIVVCAD